MVESAGKILNKKIRKELIYAYEQYLDDESDKDNYFQDIAIGYDIEYPQMYTEIVNKALNYTWAMQDPEKSGAGKKVSKEEAKRILESLKKEDKEDK